ncbi:MAG: hypothetical protein JWQ96_2084 [Segetibacter sp.]|nr:hypothetical protein [Segetibacter sp.]
MVSALLILFGAFCKGRRSKTSIYPAFEVILGKTPNLSSLLFSRKHPGRTGKTLGKVKRNYTAHTQYIAIYTAN